MDEAKLRTVAQLQEFLNATQEINFTGAPGDGDHQRKNRGPAFLSWSVRTTNWCRRIAPKPLLDGGMFHFKFTPLPGMTCL